MENASKALLIAASVLIVILLIGVGMAIFGSVGSTTEQVGSQAETLAIQTFNGQFTPYEGKDKTASQLRSLINAVNASNAANTNSHQITPITVTPNNAKRYTIQCNPDATTGYITSITVTEQ